MRPIFARLSIPLVVAAAIGVAWATSSAPAAVTCPSSVPVLSENNCKGEGSSDWMSGNYDDGIAGFATQTSFNVGQSVPLPNVTSSCSATSRSSSASTCATRPT